MADFLLSSSHRENRKLSQPSAEIWLRRVIFFSQLNAYAEKTRGENPGEWAKQEFSSSLRYLILPSKWVRSSFVRLTVSSAFTMALITLPLSPLRKKNVNFSSVASQTFYRNEIWLIKRDHGNGRVSSKPALLISLLSLSLGPRA